MADAYGGITLSTSDDSVINAEYLIQQLNTFQWTNGNGEWIHKEIDGRSTFWHKCDSNTQYPSLFPTAYTAVIKKNDDGSITKIDIDQASDDDIKSASDFDWEYVTLNELSLDLSPPVKEGWVEIACVANEKNRYVYFQSLRIYANGKVIRRKIESGTCLTEPIDETDSYKPVDIRF
jgi:hypothetical protein